MSLSGETFKKLFNFGLNVPTKNGSHSYILTGKRIFYNFGGRAVVAGHEVFGHGVAWQANNTGNNLNAVQMENLFLRVMGLGNHQRIGQEHGNTSEAASRSVPIFRYRPKKIRKNEI